MKLFPSTLLGRTALVLGVILVLGSAVSTAAIGYFLLLPLRKTYDRQLADSITMAQALLAQNPPDASRPRDRSPFSNFVGFRILADDEPLPPFLAPDKRTIPPISSRISNAGSARASSSSRPPSAKSYGFDSPRGRVTTGWSSPSALPRCSRIPC